MPRLFTKTLLSFLASLVILFSFGNFFEAKAAPISPPPPKSNSAAPAEGSWYSQPFDQWYAKVYDDKNPSEIFGERYTAAQVQWVVYSLISLPLNLDPDTQKVVACFIGMLGGGSTDADTCGAVLLDRFKKFDDFFKSQHTGSAQPTTFVAYVFNYKDRPMSGIGYLANLSRRLTIVKDVQAQGFGFVSLNPIQKYWTGTRDVAYSFFVLVTIIFAFMIMFRVKISPQVVISVQSALPKVFMALILVTFSYAISGFMIDLMYLIGGFIASLLVIAHFATSTTGPFGTYAALFPSNQSGLYFFVQLLVYDVFFLISLVISLVGVILAGPVKWIAGGLFVIVGIVLVVWILVLCIWYSIKGTWMLVTTLVSVYINIITSPLQFMLSPLVPSMSFTNWFKKMLADLLVFPVTGLFMFFAWSLMWTSYSFALGTIVKQNIIVQIIALIATWTGNPNPLFTVIWVPEILGFGESVSGIIVLMMSFGVVLAIPKIPAMLKGAILGEKFSFGQALGQEVSQQGALVAGGVGMAAGAAGDTPQGRILAKFANTIEHLTKNMGR